MKSRFVKNAAALALLLSQVLATGAFASGVNHHYATRTSTIDDKSSGCQDANQSAQDAAVCNDPSETPGASNIVLSSCDCGYPNADSNLHCSVTADWDCQTQ